MGFLVAATAPEHLEATAVSGLIDDFYRGILYPGGVPNSGFPVAWAPACGRPASCRATGRRSSSDPTARRTSSSTR